MASASQRLLPVDTREGSRPWANWVAAVSVGMFAGALIAATTAAPASSLYSTVAQPVASTATTTTNQAVYGRMPTVYSGARVNHVAPAAVSAGAGIPVEVLQMKQAPVSGLSLPLAASAVVLLVGSVIYNYFKQPQVRSLAVPGPLQAVVVPQTAARSVKLSTGLADARTSYAMMAVTSEKKVKGIKSPVFAETCDQTGITLSRFMLEVARANPELVELESVFSSVQTACKTISKLVKRSAIDGMTGYAGGGGSINVQGEEQKKLDVITNDVLKRALKFTGRMGVIASEEEDAPVNVENKLDESYESDVLVEEGGKYISVFDPLDGSSNIDAGIPVGTIFGIFEEDDDCVLPDDFFQEGADMSEAMQQCLRSTLKPGNSLVAAGYALYSSATHFVFTLGDGVNGFTLDESIGEFILTHPNIKVPPRGKIYSINEANRDNWDEPTKAWIDSLAKGTNRGGSVYTSRYIGSMVGDVHRTLLYGGVFGYPADSKNVNGKLRLLYEAAPMSYLIEQAGGKSTTGMARIMDLPPKDVHQRVPLMMGGSDEIEELEEFYEKLADDELKASQAARKTVKLATASADATTTVAMMAISSEKKVKGIKSPVFAETCDQTGITLSRFMLEVARANPELVELESVFASVQTACKTISKLVKRSAIDGMTGYAGGGGSINVQGEEQKKLDVITNDVLKRALKFTGRMGVIASEEEDAPVNVENKLDESYESDVLVEEGGKYISVFDPLDGSSNVDAGIPVGTIFGIFEEDDDCMLPDDFQEGADMSEAMQQCLRSTLKPGNSLVAAGYALYSSATHFVFTLGDGVNGFTLDESIGEFILTHPNIKVPPRGKIYSINEANRDNWDEPTKAWIDSLAKGTNRGGSVYTSRYIGSMVGDVHRTLLYGGVFGYPADSKNVNGKLRLLYEAAPMSYLIEQAGGKSTTGMARIMDLPPKDVHQRVPLMMGGSDEIEELEEFYEKLADDELKASQAARKTVKLATASADATTTVAMMAISSEKKVKGIKSPVFAETCDQTGITLSRFMLEVARANPELVELESVFASVQTACKTISKLVKRSAIDGMTGYAGGGGSINVQGEEQKKLDVITNDVLKRALKFTGRMGVIASEEEDAPVNVENKLDESYESDVLVEEGGKYISVFDPLDGSSNVDAGIPVGTIFGIFEEDDDCMLPDDFQEGADMSEAMQQCLRSTLKPGNSLVAAGYALYSSATHFVFTLGDGVNGFTLDESIGEFILTHPNIKVPPRGKIYSINEANRDNWDEPTKAWIDSLAKGTNRGGSAYTSRYIGSMVGDVHRTLLYGGVFGYPADSKNVNGKLRLLYEAAPMSYLIEQAGGKSTTGMARIMDLPPKDVHQRVPLMMGGSDEIEELEEFYEKLADDELKASQAARKTVKLATASADATTTVAMMAISSEKKVKGIKSPVFAETCDQTGITLSRFMLEVARANPELVELESVFASVQTACKTISKLVKRSAIDGMTGYAGGGGSINVQGEEQKKLDVITNDVLKRALKFTGRMGVIASEEEDAPVNVENKLDESYESDVLVEEGGKYISVFDPLDGSSNVDAGIPVGTIFGIFEEDDDCMLPDDFQEGADMSEAMQQCLRSTLKPGNSLVAAGYALYSSATHFVFTLGDGVNGFTLDESIGEFILTHPNIKVPPRGKIYSINEANRDNWDEPTKAWIDSLAKGTNRGGSVYTSRYIGSMVGDVHRTLLYGGVFGYPADSKNVNGKLRLLYEAAPMSYLIEQAGGKSTTGMARIMDLPPKDVHQRVPLMMGGSDEIEELEEFYTNLADDELKQSQSARLIV